ncbi:MAG: universal stress protein, partial [Planctomycetota bacterium]|nr:universal stress protein [Planctomycetota bacterium]
MGFQRILALSDLSENSCSGLALADQLARRMHAHVTVGYAHTNPNLLRGYSHSETDTERLAVWVRQEDEERLQHLAREHIEALRLDGLATVDAARSRAGVTELIARVKPDLVCMATRGRSGLGHLLLGSIAEHTIRTAGVPVVVTRGAAIPAADDPIKVLVAADLLDDPFYLAHRVAAFLRPNDELVMAHVVESWYYSPAPYGSEFALPQPDVPKLVAAASERLSSLDLGPEAPTVSVVVKPGRAGEALVALEGEVKPHLVVARTHGRRGFDRMMLGSVSEYLA